jgi:hypothetical protein
MKHIERALEATIDYLNGNDSALSSYDFNDIEVGFFNTPIRYKDEIFVSGQYVKRLLHALKVPIKMREKYLKSTATVFGLLNILSDRAQKHVLPGNERLEEFIKKVENFQLINTLQFVENHLKNGNNNKQYLLEYMTSYDKKMAKVNKDFYTTTVNSDPQVLQAVESILESLGIDKQKWGRYTGSSLTIYAMLKEVVEHTAPESKEKLTQLKTLVNAIKTKSKISWQKALLYGLAVVLPVVASIPFGGGGAIEQILTASLFAPVFGLSTTLGIGAYSLYKTTFDKNIPLLDKLRDNFLVIASSCLKIAAYGLVIATAATGLPIVGVLTVTAAAIGVLREGFKLLQMNIKNKAERVEANEDNLITNQQNARCDADFEKKKNSLKINVVAAIVLTGIAAVSCFVPGGAVVVGSALLATVLTHVVQLKINKYMEKLSVKKLHATFDHLEIADREKALLKEGLSKQSGHLAKLQKSSGLNQDNTQPDSRLASSSDSSGYNSDEENTSAPPLSEEDAEDKHPLLNFAIV